MKEQKRIIHNQKNKKNFLDKLYLFFLALYMITYILPLPSYLGYIPFTLVIIHSIASNNVLKFRLKVFHCWYISVLVFFVISSYWALRPVLSLWATLQVFKLVVFAFSVYRYCSTPNRLFDVLKIYIFANFILLLFILLYFDLSSLGGDRMSDNELGLNGNYIALSFVFCLYAFGVIFKLFKIGVKTKFFYLSLSVVFLGFILLTGSRSAIVMLVLPLSLFQFLKSKNKIASLLSISLLMMVVFFVVMKIPFFYNVIGVRLEDAFNVLSGNGKGTEDVSRILLVANGIVWFQENMFLGVGVNNFRVLSNKVHPFIGKNFYAHNNVIEMLVGVGIVGTIIYYRYLFIFFTRVRKVKDKLVKKIIISLTISFFINDMFIVSYYLLERCFFICIIFVMLSLYNDKNRSNNFE